MTRHNLEISVIVLLISVCSANSQWTQISTIPVSKISAIKFFNETTGFACGGGVWKTVDGGYNWIQMLNASTNSICFVDSMNGYAGGVPSIIYKTTNGGLNWSSYSLVSGLGGVDAMSFFNALTGLSIGFHGIINRTSNAGTTWQRQDTTYFQEQEAISTLDNGHGWIVGFGVYEVIKKTTNYGLSWVFQSPGAIGALNAVFAFDNNLIYVCGHYGTIRRSTTGGGNWIKLDSMTNRHLRGVHFTSSTSGTVVGESGTILRTTNSGANWFFQSSPTSSSLFAVQYLNEETGWIGGNNGVILRTTNGGFTFINQVNTAVPNDYQLFQNYPNPFNPKTIITFSVLRSGRVNLTIYNSSGEEIWSHTKNNLNPGKYEIEWNAEGYASGVYFYTMESNDVFLTKKMILIK
ncbi:MAG: T9SS type A sorting domain-containing protein [Ignavibacteria bacterium]|nr:T9SS type A sorting domain-containing protein [Ignavibacteria bacterium]